MSEELQRIQIVFWSNKPERPEGSVWEHHYRIFIRFDKISQQYVGSVLRVSGSRIKMPPSYNVDARQLKSNIIQKITKKFQHLRWDIKIG